MQSRILVASALVAMSTAAAVAADLPSRKAAPVYIPPPPAFSWTGAYLGVNAGVAIGDSSFAGSAPLNGAAFLGGVTIGLNYQWSPNIVLGVETDADYRGQISGGQSNGLFASSSSIGYLGTVRARLGYTLLDNRLMAYATGGLAYGNGIAPQWYSGFFAPGGYGVHYSDAAAILPGWTVGGGLEYAVIPNWSVKVEYLYARLSDEYPAYFVGPAFVPIGTSIANIYNRSAMHIVRGGVNYHFNWGAPAPVVAKY